MDGFYGFDRYNNRPWRGEVSSWCVSDIRAVPRRDKRTTYGYGNLRDYALADDKAGLEQLGRRYSFIDTNRIGIFGHSGGMMAFAAICTYPDFYKVAMASFKIPTIVCPIVPGETYQGIRDDHKLP
ncbi:MAG: alpha/beta hydrolase family protein [Butyricimonas faecalis]